MASNLVKNGANMATKWALEVLGALEEAWSAKGRLPGMYVALLDASWGALGALLEAFGAQNTLLGSALGAAKATKETGFE